ncbi:protein PIN-LIKES 7-like isoform X1 [Nymphaea colorata]|nr:protein PIN-LIKES 7-like isoform X1 [Nymphaea colorata]
MGFWTLFEASSVPVLQVLIVSGLGAFLATPYCNVLKDDATKHLNKIVFVVFTPCLVFASLVQSVTLEDIISWWFMPVNILLIYIIGGFLGWVAVKLLKPEPFLKGVVIACCSAGNLGNLMIIIIPAICDEKGTPFGNSGACTKIGLAYSSFSMALGAFYIWTHTYHMMRSAGEVYHAEIGSQKPSIKVANADLEAGAETHLLKAVDGSSSAHVPSSESYAAALSLPLSKSAEAAADQAQRPEPDLNGKPNSNKKGKTWENIKGLLHRILEELFAPPTIAAIVGLVFGAIPGLKSLIIGSAAPLRVIEQSVSLLGNATIPCITLILGGNLTKGLRLGKLKISMMISIICVRYVILPASGILVVRLANSLGLLPPDPLYRYVLMVQFTLPPAMAIGTMAELFNVGKQESSIIFLFTYLVAAVALTFWSTVYMWMLS